MRVNHQHVLELQDFSQDSIEELIDDVTATPSVTVVCDMTELRLGMDKAYDPFMNRSDLSYGCMKLASTMGRLARTIVCVDGPRSDLELKMWRRVGVNPGWSDFDGSNLIWTTERVVTSLADNPSKIYIFVCGNSTYIELVKSCKSKGCIVACVAPLKRGRVKRILEHADIVVDIDEVARLEEEVDLEDYDFTDFIRTLDQLLERMPFVGVKYFIEQQMSNKLNLGSIKTCHLVFHKAKELGIITVVAQPNVDPTAKDVSAIELCQEHELVREVLEPSSAIL